MYAKKAFTSTAIDNLKIFTINRVGDWTDPLGIVASYLIKSGVSKGSFGTLGNAGDSWTSNDVIITITQTVSIAKDEVIPMELYFYNNDKTPQVP
jgi:hypothetical protein